MISLVNADTPQQALSALAAGAEGIGLSRTEHLLVRPECLSGMRTLAWGSSEHERREALSTLLPLHRSDTEEILRTMAGKPVNFRLLDPPLQDFLPTLHDLKIELSAARSEENWEQAFALDALREQHAQLLALNPMLGNRGCRVSVTNPEFLRMQVTAILQAALKLEAEGLETSPGIVIPLVSSEEEVRLLAHSISRIAAEVFSVCGRTAEYRLGALIELPRAAILAGAICRHVDFICFGTNDLTQMTFGFSKGDARLCLEHYVEQGIFKADPFVSLDQEGVGHLIAFAVREIRSHAPGVPIGACGDHASDPASVRFFEDLGLDFVSCALGKQAAVAHT